MYYLIFILFLIILFIQIYMTKKLKQKEKELLQKDEIFDENICSATTDPDGIITHISQAYCKLSGYEAHELIGNTHAKLRESETPAQTYKDLWMTISSGHIWSGELKNIDKDQQPYWVNIIISPYFNKYGEIISYNSIVQDISAKVVLKKFNHELESEVKRQTVELQKLANTDKLTGLYNRLKTDEELERNFKYFTEHNENFSIVIFDIDLFKNINDIHGHQVGDRTLVEVSKIMKENCRSTDILGRWGGEEFMLICPSSNLKNTLKIAQDIRKMIDKKNFARIKHLSISAGVAEIQAHASIDKLVNAADSALYEAKNNGRNQVRTA